LGYGEWIAEEGFVERRGLWFYIFLSHLLEEQRPAWGGLIN
jgi:hypothetical protein